MSLNTETKYALDRMNSTAIKYALGTKLHQAKNNVCGIYDFTTQGGATGALNVKDEDGNNVVLPAGAIITNVIAHAAVAVTTSASGTISLGANTTTDLQGATAAATLSLNALVAGVPVGTAATSVRCTAERTIQVTIATGALTAGKVYYFIEYMLSV
jgi:hypothetical protein